MSVGELCVSVGGWVGGWVEMDVSIYSLSLRSMARAGAQYITLIHTFSRVTVNNICPTCSTA